METLRSRKENWVIQDHPEMKDRPKPRNQSPGLQLKLLFPVCTYTAVPGEAAVLIFWGWCNKLPQTRWLKTMGIYSLSSGGQKSKIKVVAEARSLPRLWGRIFACLFQLLELLAFLGLWQHHSDLCFCLPMAFSSVSLCVLHFRPSNLPLPHFCKDTCHWI